MQPAELVGRSFRFLQLGLSLNLWNANSQLHRVGIILYHVQAFHYPVLFNVVKSNVGKIKFVEAVIELIFRKVRFP